MRFLILTAFALFTLSCAQKKVKFKEFFVNKKDLKITNFDTVFLDGVINFYDSTNRLVEVSGYKNNLKNGVSYLYDNDSLKAEISFQNGIKNGYAKYYDDSGRILAESNFKNGINIGVEKEYKRGEIYYFGFSNQVGKKIYHSFYEEGALASIYGNLVNYETEVNQNSNKLILSIYLFNPPHFDYIIYEIIDKDLIKNRYNTLKTLNSSENSLKVISLDLPQKNHIYILKSTFKMSFYENPIYREDNISFKTGKQNFAGYRY
jgi:hypothetical protein